MSAYRRILVAVDLSQDSHAVASRALQVRSAQEGEIRLLHVVEFVPIEPMSDSLVPVVQIDDQMIMRAREQIGALARELGLPVAAGSVETGNVKNEILRHARDGHCDLIVIGCRERHGLSLLMHRRENSVLHGAPCDVLAVRVGESASAPAPAGARGHPA
jgi:universal stress protein A